MATRRPQGKDQGLEKNYVAEALARDARRLREAGDLPRAFNMFQKALAEKRQAVPGTEVALLDECGYTLVLLQRYQDSVPYFQQATEILQREYYLDHPRIAPILDHWSAACLYMGELDKAEKLAEHSLAIKQKSLLMTDAITLEGMRTLGEIKRRLHKFAEAETLLKQAIKLVEPSTIGPLEEFYYELALLYQDQGRYHEAEQFYKVALPMFARRAGKWRRLATALQSYCELLRVTRRQLLANKLDQEADRLLERVETEEPADNRPGMLVFETGLYPATILH